MTMGERIRTLRKEKGFKQEELAEKAKVSRVSIGFYERDERMPPTDIAARIAKVLNVDVDYLIKDDLGLTGNAQEALKHRQRHKDADVTVDGVCSSYKKIDNATDAVINYTGFLAAIAEYIHTPDDGKSEVLYYTPNAALIEEWMTKEERQAFYAGLIVQKLPELRARALNKENDNAEEESPER